MAGRRVTVDQASEPLAAPPTTGRPPLPPPTPFDAPASPTAAQPPRCSPPSLGRPSAMAGYLCRQEVSAEAAPALQERTR